MRVLAIAEAANPEWPSVPLVGWSLCEALRKVCDLHVLTQVRNREAILRAGWVEGSDFTTVDSEPVAAPLNRIANVLRGGKGRGWTMKTALASLGYPYFEYLAWKTFRERLQSKEFDLVHRITPLTPTAPSPMAKKCRRIGIPFVLGPLNGGLPWPPGFERTRRAEFEWLSQFRAVYKLLPGYRSTRRNASAILLGSRATWRDMPHQYHSKCFYLPENGIYPEQWAVKRERSPAGYLRAIFVGRLVPYKGPDFVLQASAPLVRAGVIALDIVGEGPLMPSLRRLAVTETLGGGVRLWGWLDQSQIRQRFASADVLAFPSIREFGGGVVLEAMAAGVVPIVVDYGGPAELVTECTGFILPLISREELVGSLRSLLAWLVTNPEAVWERSAAAMERASSLFSWRRKAEIIMQVYDWLARRGPRPVLLPPGPLARTNNDKASES
jgi:glycosyltransferase involved in cell wall biosynthesis